MGRIKATVEKMASRTPQVTRTPPQVAIVQRVLRSQRRLAGRRKFPLASRLTPGGARRPRPRVLSPEGPAPLRAALRHPAISSCSTERPEVGGP